MTPGPEGYGGVFYFNAPKELLQWAADEAQLVFIALILTGHPLAGPSQRH